MGWRYRLGMRLNLLSYKIRETENTPPAVLERLRKWFGVIQFSRRDKDYRSLVRNYQEILYGIKDFN